MFIMDNIVIHKYCFNGRNFPPKSSLFLVM